MKHNPESEAPVPRNSHHSLNIDHHGASSLIRDASVCDLAVEKASTGDYRAAYDTIVQILDGDSPLRPRAVEIAAKLIDKIVDEYEEENYEAAIPWLDRWLSIDPEALYPAVAKADMLWLYLDRPSDAARIYRSVVRKHPYCLEGWIGLAQLLSLKDIIGVHYATFVVLGCLSPIPCGLSRPQQERLSLI